MERIIECVPNFSEGRDMAIINKIVESIEKSGGVKVLDVDPGEATNRTVVTFVGSPENVLEAAFNGVKKAGELIDMRHHKGAHPRSGATDVLPLIPIAGITLEECAELARGLAKRIYEELEIPCYCYEAAAMKPERKNLAVCRAGEYEALPEKMSDPQKAPDFGPGKYTERTAISGATNVGARDFLIAVNFNLNTTSTRRANAIAFDVREKGRPVRNLPQGLHRRSSLFVPVLHQDKGNPVSDQRRGDHLRRVEMSLNIIVKKNRYNGSGNAGHYHLHPHGKDVFSDDWLRLISKLKGKHFLPEQQHHRQDRPQLDHHKKHIFKRAAGVQRQELVHQQHMAGAADRQPFGNSLHNAKKHRFQNLQDTNAHLSSSFLPSSFFSFPNPSSQKATALAAATFRESTPWNMGMRTV